MFVFGLIVVAYVAAAVLLRDTLPDGTTIEGVPAGDTVTEATKTTQELAAVAARAPVTLTAGDNTTTLDPASAGLSVDVPATVAGAGGFTLDPTVLWHRVRGEGTDHDVVVVAAEPAFTNAVSGAVQQLNSEKSDASVAIEGKSAVVTDGSQAVVVDAEAAKDEILAEWPTKQPVALTAEVTDPDITTSEAKGLAASLNGHVFAGPTSLTGDNGDVVLPAGKVAAFSSIVAANGTLTWTVDGAGLSAFILDSYPWVENESTSATYHFTAKHKLKVTKGEPGRNARYRQGRRGGHRGRRHYGTLRANSVHRYGPKGHGRGSANSRLHHAHLPLPHAASRPSPSAPRISCERPKLVTGTVVKPGKKFDLTKVDWPHHRGKWLLRRLTSS